MQSIALGTCIHLLLGVNMKVGMIIGMAIILAYTLSSGMWGVAMTDYVQFVFLAALIVKVVVSKNLYSCFDRLSDIVLYLT